MEDFNKLLNNSKKKLALADYMLTNTYEMLKEPKILLSILQNIDLAFMNSLRSILVFERIFKRVPVFGESYTSMSNIYLSKVQKRYKFDSKFIKNMNKIKEITESHISSQIEFERKEDFIIADDNYKLKKITKNEIILFLKCGKEFNQKITKILEDYND